MSGIDPTRDNDYMRLKLRDITVRIQELENGSLLTLLAASLTTPYGVIQPGMLVPTLADVPGNGEPLPGGYFWSEGSEVSRSVYNRLWVAMGSPNTGDGSTTFTLTNTTNKAPFGAGTLALQATAGSGASHDHTTSIPSGGGHDHGFQTGGVHNHGAPVGTVDRGTGALQTAGGGHNHNDDGGHGHSFSGTTDHNHGGGGNTGSASVGAFGVKWLVKF